MRIRGSKKSYDKTMLITAKTSVEPVPTPGKFVLAVTGFNSARKNRRLIDFKSQQTLDTWRQRIEGVAARGSDQGDMFPTGSFMCPPLVGS